MVAPAVVGANGVILEARRGIMLCFRRNELPENRKIHGVLGLMIEEWKDSTTYLVKALLVFNHAF